MTTVSNNRNVLAAVRQRLQSQGQMDGQTGSIIAKMLRGGQLTKAEQEIAATSGLSRSVNDLINATAQVQTAQGPIASSVASINVATKVRAVGRSAAAVDQIYAQDNPHYAKVSNNVHNSWAGKAYAKSEPIQDKFFGAAGNAATVAGFGLSAIALPTMAKKTASGVVELIHEVHDPNATTDTRLNTLGSTAQSAAGTIFSAQGVVLGAKGTTEILSRTKSLGSVVQGISNSKVMAFLGSPIGKAVNVLLPVADGAVFVGSAVALRSALRDPNSTKSAKLKAELTFGLSGIKLAFWLLPGFQQLHTLYNIASIGQLAMTVWEYHAAIGHAIVKTAKAIGWGILHPVQAAKNIGHAAVGAAVGVANAVGKVAGWTFDKLLHPVRSVDTVVHEVKTWYQAIFNRTPHAIQGWFGAPPATTTPATATPAAVAPVLPGQAPSVVPMAAPAAIPAAPAPAIQAVVSPPSSVAATPSTVTQAPSNDAAYQSALAQLNGAASQP